MIITDLISEYKYVYDVLNPCNDYFSTCDSLINNFFTGICGIIGPYYQKLSPSDTEKATVISNVTKVFDNSYTSISKLVSLCYPLYGSMAKLEEYKFRIPALRYHVRKFLESGHVVISATNSIISEQSYGMKTKALLPTLILPLRELMLNFHSLQSYYEQVKDLDEILFENIPAIESESDKYNRIELHSLKPLDTDSFINDLKNIFSFISQFELIMTSENASCKIYTQRIESGSLRIAWGSTTIELSSISDIIRAISDGIRTFRLTSTEKRHKNEEARTLKLQNDEKELAIINSQIRTIAQITGLSVEKPADVEKLQKLCLPLVRYLYSNPVGAIGDYTYDINNELRLIETTFSTATEPYIE